MSHAFDKRGRDSGKNSFKECLDLISFKECLICSVSRNVDLISFKEFRSDKFQGMLI